MWKSVTMICKEHSCLVEIWMVIVSFCIYILNLGVDFLVTIKK